MWLWIVYVSHFIFIQENVSKLSSTKRPSLNVLNLSTQVLPVYLWLSQRYFWYFDAICPGTTPSDVGYLVQHLSVMLLPWCMPLIVVSQSCSTLYIFHNVFAITYIICLTLRCGMKTCFVEVFGIWWQNLSFCVKRPYCLIGFYVIVHDVTSHQR